MKKEGQDYSEDITESFPYFCLKIFWDDFSEDDIADALQGLTTNDEGIDAFFVDESNKEINIIQCKSCTSEKNKSALKKEWLSLLSDVPRKLTNRSFIDDHQNDRVKEIAAEYAKYTHRNFAVKLHFFHLGTCANKNTLKPDENIVTYYDWNRIKDEYEEYLSKLDRTEPPSIEVQLNFAPLEPSVSNKHRTFVSVITGDEIINLRQQYRYRLFDKNLRFGLGKNKVNNKMMETAKREPENFYFYNNGITITSKGFRFRDTNSKLKIEYPQIINGAQTVNAIYEAFKDKEKSLAMRKPSIDSGLEAKEEFKRLRLLFRVIQDDEKDGRKTSPFEKEVIRYNNSQNSIKETDFYANEPEQIKLQELFSKFGYFYEIKRGDRKFLEPGKEEHNLLNKRKRDFEHWEEKIGIEKLASIWMAYYQDPNLDKIQKSNIFGHAQDKYYDAIFEDADKITEDQVKEMILACNLFDCFSKQAEIYGNTMKKGQIIPKITQITDTDPKDKFENIKEIIGGSFLFGRMIKEDFESQDKFFLKKDSLIDHIKKYHFFSTGKYITLAIFRLILEECGYKKAIIEDFEIFQKKDSIDKYLVQAWLKIILDELLIKEHDDFIKNVGSSPKVFYRRTGTWDNIQKRFQELRYDKDKPFNEIFPLDFTSA